MVPVIDISISVQLVDLYGTVTYNTMGKICEPLVAIWMHTSVRLGFDP